MSEFQVLTILASLLGLIATVLNLVAFVREKDKSHTRAGVLVLTGLALLLALLYLPHYAPNFTRNLVSHLPESAQGGLQSWVQPAPAASPTVPTPLPDPLQGSCSIEIQRNLLGGIGRLVANFQFSNLSPDTVRVSAYHIQITEKAGDAVHSFDRVLPDPISIAGNGTAKSQVELDADIRDHWVAWHDGETPKRGPIEIRWDVQDAQGRRFSVTASNG